MIGRQRRPARKHFLREWRQFRNFTQQQLADRADLTPGAISQLENFRVKMTQPTLEALADAMNCEPGHIWMVNPQKDDAIWSIWERASEAEKEQIVSVARALTKRASGAS